MQPRPPLLHVRLLLGCPLASLPLQQLLLADQALHLQVPNSCRLRRGHTPLQQAARAEWLAAPLLAGSDSARGLQLSSCRAAPKLVTEPQALRTELRWRGRRDRGRLLR